MKIGILGTGAFGLAIASILNKNDNNITMWTKFESEYIDLKNNKTRKNLNNYIIPNNIKFTTNIKRACIDCEIIFIVVPAQFVTSTCKEAKAYIKNQHICIASKGIEEGTNEFLPDIVKQILNTKKIGVISGPTFAQDIINNAPIGFSLASYNSKTSNIIYKALKNDKLKIVITDDVIGTCICGTIKNVLAITSGIICGLNYPISTQAILLTQSLQDIEKLLKKLGGSERTILSLAGFGDIILTCMSEKSRNYSLGKLIGSKAGNDKITKYINSNTVEGLDALKSIHNITINNKINIPIIDLIFSIIYESAEPEQIINFLVK